MRYPRKITLELLYAFSLLCAVSSVGCSSLTGGRDRTSLSGLDTKAIQAAGYSIGAGAAQVPIPKSSDAPSVILEVINGKQHFERIPLPPESPVFIEDIIRDAKLTDRLGSINVTIMRPTTANNPPIRMEVDFDSRGEKVMTGQNYALRPGDKIVVIPASRDWTNKVFSNLMPFATGKR